MRNLFTTFLKAAFALVFLAAPLAADGQTVRYHVVQLPPVPAQSGCVPTAINENGDVVGYCNAGGLNSFAVVWRGGVVEDLSTWAGGTFTHAWGINSLGQVVGDGDDGDFRSKALLRGPLDWIQLDNSGGSTQQAYGITDAGVIFGNYTTQGGSIGTIDWDPVYWVYDAGHDRYDRVDLAKPPAQPQPAGTRPLSGAFIFAASRTGIAVGDVTSDIVGNAAGLWNNDASHSLVVLDRPAGFVSVGAYGVSDDGRAAGVAFGANNLQHAVLWQNDAPHTAVDLGLLPGDVKSGAAAVNSSGQVVGTSIDASSFGRGFLYQNGTMTDLATLIDPTEGDWTINRAVGINNAGQIIGEGTLNGVRVPVKLVPFVPPVTSVTLVADRPAPQPPGTTVTLTATATGGVAPIQFRWYLYNGSTWTILQDWSTADTFAWTPMTANGAYSLQVWAKSAGNPGGADKAAGKAFPILASSVSALTLSADRVAPQTPGTTVTFTASATGGVGPIQFRWYLHDGLSWTLLRDWDASTTFAWTPTVANSAYSLQVWAKSAGNPGGPEKAAGKSFPILADFVSAVTVSADRAAPQAPGTTVTFTAAATGGVGPIQFRWYLYNGSTWTLLQDWSTSTTFAWTPAASNGAYSLQVWAKSAVNPGGAERAAGISFPILATSVTSLTVRADRAAPQLPGTTVTFTATAAGGVGPIQFRWYLYDGSTWTLLQDWNTSPTFAWIPAVANGAYSLQVWAKSADNPGGPEKAAGLAFPIVESTP